jgi:hypothetical protein
VKILQCDSKGDKRFSPFFCRLEAFGVRDSIEDHYQKSKVFVTEGGELVHPADWREAKKMQKPPPHGLGLALFPEFRLPNGWYCPGKFHVFGWYSSLWLKYLDSHPELVEFASGFNEFHDRFKGSFPLCQADCVRLYCKQGRPALLETCKEFLDWARAQREERGVSR